MSIVHDKVILYGIGHNCKKILNTLKGASNFVECFIDNYSDKKSMYDIKVYKPEVLDHPSYDNFKIVITPTRKYYEIYGFLRKEYKISDERILSIREWVIELLRDIDIKIKPNSVRIESTTYCQLDCIDCYMRKNNNGVLGKGFLTYDNFRQFVEKHPNINHIELSNSGEPFLNLELPPIIKLAYDKGILLTFANGTNFNTVSDETLEALVKYEVGMITFSIDGASQEIYSQYRRNGDYNTVINNIKKLNKYKQIYHIDKPNLVWQFILMEHNQKEAEKAKNMARELGMSINFKLDWGKGINPEESEELSKITGLKYFNRNEYNKNNLVKYGNEKCSLMLFSPQINWDGRLLGCCSVFKSDWGSNLFETDLETALNKEDYRKAILWFLGGNSNIDPNTPCGKCIHYKSSIEAGNYVEI